MENETQPSRGPVHALVGRPSSRIQYRDPSEGPGIDEAVIIGAESVHIEALNDNLLWICVNRPVGERIVFTVSRARKYLRLEQTEPEANQKDHGAGAQEPSDGK